MHASFLDTIRHDTVSFYGFNNDPTNTFSWHFWRRQQFFINEPCTHLRATGNLSGEPHHHYNLWMLKFCISQCGNTSINLFIAIYDRPDSLVPHHYYVIIMQLALHLYTIIGHGEMATMIP